MPMPVAAYPNAFMIDVSSLFELCVPTFRN
jgi:hypothetical protein